MQFSAVVVNSNESISGVSIAEVPTVLPALQLLPPAAAPTALPLPPAAALTVPQLLLLAEVPGRHRNVLNPLTAVLIVMHFAAGHNCIILHCGCVA
jgi:hypothetical protein